jgi:PST family polysaccharide transporter
VPRIHFESVVYFQGSERLALLSGITIVMRTISVLLTFLFVARRNDLAIAMAISAGTTLITGVACLILLLRERAIRLVAISRKDLVVALCDGWQLFLSTAAISLYTTTNVVLLGFVAGSVAVGYYSAAEKLIKAAQGLISPISQSVYPRITRLMQQSKTEAFGFLRRLLYLQGGTR